MKESIDIEKVKEECLELVRSVGATPEKYITAEYAMKNETGAMSGVCRFIPESYGMTYKILIKKSLSNPKVNLKMLKSLMCHELLHACNGGLDHSDEKYIEFGEKLLNLGIDVFLMHKKEDFFPSKQKIDPIAIKQCPECKRYKKIYLQEELEKSERCASCFSKLEIKKL